MHQIKLELLTPTFCGGSDPAVSQLRVPSIRGAIRWWFRLLYNDAAVEKEIFGGLSDKGNEGKSSAVVIRISDVNLADFKKHECAPNNTFFAGRQKVGLGIGTSFTLTVVWRRKIDPELVDKFNQVLNVFSLLGSIGSRAGRGCGALGYKEATITLEQLNSIAPELSLSLPTDWSFNKSQKQCVEIMEAYSKALQKTLPGKNATGWAEGNSRQASAMKYTVVKVKEGLVPVVYYTDEFLADGVKSISNQLELTFFCETSKQQHTFEQI